MVSVLLIKMIAYWLILDSLFRVCQCLWFHSGRQSSPPGLPTILIQLTTPTSRRWWKSIPMTPTLGLGELQGGPIVENRKGLGPPLYLAHLQDWKRPSKGAGERSRELLLNSTRGWGERCQKLMECSGGKGEGVSGAYGRTLSTRYAQHSNLFENDVRKGSQKYPAIT